MLRCSGLVAGLRNTRGARPPVIGYVAWEECKICIISRVTQ